MQAEKDAGRPQRPHPSRLLKRPRPGPAGTVQVAPQSDYSAGQQRFQVEPAPLSATVSHHEDSEIDGSTIVVLPDGEDLSFPANAASDASTACSGDDSLIGKDAPEPDDGDDHSSPPPSSPSSGEWSDDGDSSWTEEHHRSSKRRRTGGQGSGAKTARLRRQLGFGLQRQSSKELFGQGKRCPSSRFPDVKWAHSMYGKLEKHLEAAKVRHKGFGPLRMGTDCSGAEAPWFALQLIREQLANQLEWNLELWHRFACDIEPASQKFIAQNTQPTALFENVLTRNDFGNCLFTEKEVQVPSDLHLYVAGFPCKDFSILNSNRPCLEGPHAGVFHGVVRYIERHSPATFVLENVHGLMMTKNGEEAPIKKVLEILTALPHYQVKAWRVNSLDYFLPQNRVRVYIVGVHTEKATLHRPLEQWQGFIESLVERSQVPLHDFMLDDTENEVKSEVHRLESRQGKHHESSAGRWTKSHKKLRKQLGVRSDAKPLVPPGCGWSRFLSQRSQDVLDIQAIRISKSKAQQESAKDPMSSEFSTEISRSAVYGSSRWRSTPCLTPGSRIWVFNRQRWLLGREMLALQGFPVDELDLNGLEDRHLALLAGNAMSVPVVGLFLYLILAHVSFKADTDAPRTLD
mmetsp:Transcript_46404/g.86703  ORF Transcript_46404/g.86703 Transcript_46404/m.86703 type:complete len:630 (-) Transcript_46404:161-2050(-)